MSLAVGADELGVMQRSADDLQEALRTPVHRYADADHVIVLTRALADGLQALFPPR